MYSTNPPRSPKEVLSTIYDLPWEDSQRLELPDECHLLQPQLLGDTFRPPNYLLEQILVARDVKLYYDPQQITWYKCPDWFAVVGVDPFYEQRDLRKSYRVWQEPVNPVVVVEILSPETEKEDLEQTLAQVNQPPTKWDVYEGILNVPYYVVFDDKRNQMRAFHLVSTCYTELELLEPRVWMNDIQLGLGLWEGVYRGVKRPWLRWYDATGKWILTHEEREKQQAQILTEQLRAFGIEPILDFPGA
ncbi:MAG TPA: hypothetical protein DDZ80_24255 [Cyanobacteria bacterium UBA8803]|nr:hypothetical protein [Cyanobacteria bacterium UBA8803]